MTEARLDNPLSPEQAAWPVDDEQGLPRVLLHGQPPAGASLVDVIIVANLEVNGTPEGRLGCRAAVAGPGLPASGARPGRQFP